MESIILHAGIHKTGSTSLQKFCAQAADKFLEDGILYPESGRPEMAPAGHHTLAWSLRGQRGLTNLEGWRELTSEIENSSATHIVLSSEEFEACTVSEITRIRDILGKTTKVLLYLRDPVDYMVSQYKQNIKSSGEVRSFRAFASALLHRCDYEALVRRWTAGLGQGQVIVRSFEECAQAGLELSLLKILGVEPAAYKNIERERANISLEDGDTAVVRWLNEMAKFPWVQKPVVHRAKRNIVRETVVGRWFSSFMQMGLKKTLVSRGDRKWLEDQVEETSDWLVENANCPEAK